ncbi:unnamed protein product [Knipowitschia caucasica]
MIPSFLSRTSQVLPGVQNPLPQTVPQYKGLFHTSILQKMCKITNTASDESALHAVIEVTYYYQQKMGQ